MDRAVLFSVCTSLEGFSLAGTQNEMDPDLGLPAPQTLFDLFDMARSWGDPTSMGTIELHDRMSGVVITLFQTQRGNLGFVVAPARLRDEPSETTSLQMALRNGLTIFWEATLPLEYVVDASQRIDAVAYAEGLLSGTGKRKPGSYAAIHCEPLNGSPFLEEMPYSGDPEVNWLLRQAAQAATIDERTGFLVTERHDAESGITLCTVWDGEPFFSSIVEERSNVGPAHTYN